MQIRDQVTRVGGAGPRIEPAHPSSERRTGVCGDCEVCTLAFCSVLSAEEMVDLVAIRHEVALDAGHSVFETGDTAKNVFNLTTGCVRLFKLLSDGRRQVIGFVLPGEYFGLITELDYPYSAEAVTLIRACRFRREALDGLGERYPHLQRRMLQMAWEEVARLQEQMVLLGRMTPKRRVASFLLGLSERHERLGFPASPLMVAMSRGDIADYLGLTIETVSRSFSSLRKDGLIALPESTRVVLQDRAALLALVDSE
jgi:CRP/FNR family transcriptional regulator